MIYSKVAYPHVSIHHEQQFKRCLLAINDGEVQIVDSVIAINDRDISSLTTTNFHQS